MKGRKEGEVVPKYVNDRAGVDSMWSRIRERKMGVDRGKDGKLNYQERVAVIWIEKVKSVGPGTLDGVERGRGCAQDRVILADMSNVGMFKRVHKAASNPPVIVVSSDVETLGNRNRNRGRMIGVVRHTLGRRDSCRW